MVDRRACRHGSWASAPGATPGSALLHACPTRHARGYLPTLRPTRFPARHGRLRKNAARHYQRSLRTALFLPHAAAFPAFMVFVTLPLPQRALLSFICVALREHARYRTDFI